jgi:hypothetical protein
MIGLLCLPQVLLFVVGMPLSAAVVLWRHRHHLHNERTQFRFGILYAGYRDKLFWWEITIVIRKLVMVMVGGVFASRLGPDMQVYLSLALVVIFVVGHLVCQPFNEVTVYHKILHWLEMAALLACFATLYSGMLFYLGYETNRIPSWALDLASYVIIFGNSAFMMFTVIAFIFATRRESKESKGLSSAERRLHLRKLSQEKSNSKSRYQGKVTPSFRIAPKRPSLVGGMAGMAKLAVIHDKGVKNIEKHHITKDLQAKEIQRRLFLSKQRLNSRLMRRKSDGKRICNGGKKKAVVVKENITKEKMMKEKLVKKKVVKIGNFLVPKTNETNSSSLRLSPPPPPPPPPKKKISIKKVKGGTTVITKK